MVNDCFQNKRNAVINALLKTLTKQRINKFLTIKNL